LDGKADHAERLMRLHAGASISKTSVFERFGIELLPLPTSLDDAAIASSS
jgi:hypothetical protein